MKHKLLTAAATAAIMALPTVAHADGHGHDESGWYLRGNVGIGAHTDIDHTGIITGDTESEANGAFSVGIGYNLDSNWALELDASSLWTDMGQVSQAANTFSKLRTNALMINALYNFDDFGNWEPYVGAGLGKVRASASTEVSSFYNPTTGVYNLNPICSTGVGCVVNDDDNAWAVQLIAGVGYDISDRLTWDTQYRYQKTLEDMGFNGTTWSGTANNLTVGSGEMLMEDVGAHMLLTGLKYKFGAKKAMVTCWNGDQVKMIGDCPAQPVWIDCWDGSKVEQGKDVCPPEPVMITCWDGSEVEEGKAECPVRTYECWDGSVVTDISTCPPDTRSGMTQAELCGAQLRQEIIYYEFDKGQSAETRSTIDRILDIGDFCQVDNIRVVGHTDTSGSASYNLALSKRRAKDAKDELVRQGVNPDIITSEGKGETEPFVPTGDGVKEQLNRRTEVLITLSEVGYITN